MKGVKDLFEFKYSRNESGDLAYNFINMDLSQKYFLELAILKEIDELEKKIPKLEKWIGEAKEGKCMIEDTIEDSLKLWNHMLKEAQELLPKLEEMRNAFRINL